MPFLERPYLDLIPFLLKSEMNLQKAGTSKCTGFDLTQMKLFSWLFVSCLYLFFFFFFLFSFNFYFSYLRTPGTPWTMGPHTIWRCPPLSPPLKMSYMRNNLRFFSSLCIMQFIQLYHLEGKRNLNCGLALRFLFVFQSTSWLVLWPSLL